RPGAQRRHMYDELHDPARELRRIVRRHDVQQQRLRSMRHRLPERHDMRQTAAAAASRARVNGACGCPATTTDCNRTRVNTTSHRNTVAVAAPCARPTANASMPRARVWPVASSSTQADRAELPFRTGRGVRATFHSCLLSSPCSIAPARYRGAIELPLMD